MKQVSTGAGLCVLGLCIVGYPFAERLAPRAEAGAPAAAAVAAAAVAQDPPAPTVVWYGTSQANWADAGFLYRAWSDGKVEIRSWYWPGGQSACGNPSTFCVQPWRVLNDPAQGYTYRSDINFDQQVNGADLAALLNDWGDAPRHDIPPSACPLNLVNP